MLTSRRPKPPGREKHTHFKYGKAARGVRGEVKKELMRRRGCEVGRWRGGYVMNLTKAATPKRVEVLIDDINKIVKRFKK